MKRRNFSLGDSMGNNIQGWDITKKLEKKQSLYQAARWIKNNMYE